MSSRQFLIIVEVDAGQEIGFEPVAIRIFSVSSVWVSPSSPSTGTGMRVDDGP